MLTPFDDLTQCIILHLLHLSTLGADLVMMGVAIVTALILGVMAKLVLDHQMSVLKKKDGVVESGATDAEILFVGQTVKECVDIKMGVERVDSIEYSVAFGRLAMSVQA